MTFTSGAQRQHLGEALAGLLGGELHEVGEKPASASTSRAIATVMASGSTARGCGFTTTALPVTRLANRPG